MNNDNLHILVADDDVDDHMLFRDTVQKLQPGYVVTSVFDGGQTLDYLNKTGRYHDRSHPDPDFIVLDLNMPLKDGVMVLRELRSHATFSKLPVFIFTTSRNEEQKAKCFDLGANGFYTKPGNFETYKTIVLGMLDKYAGTLKQI